jgi:hypothetical protein
MTCQVKNAVLFACLALGLVTNNAGAQSFVDDHIFPTTLEVWKVEEDWELLLSEPDPNVTAPQVTTAISPVGDLGSLHAIFNLNHQALETFAPGGMQLQVWNGETPISHYRLNPDSVWSESDETVTWTQVMRMDNNALVFRIKNGHSVTWGDFGGDSLLTERVSTALEDLNDYDPAVSVANSGVVFAGNRVATLTLVEVRVYTTDGQEFVIPVNLNVHHEVE